MITDGLILMGLSSIFCIICGIIICYSNIKRFSFIFEKSLILGLIGLIVGWVLFLFGCGHLLVNTI